mmetsp:Transcript_7585/g.16460  ORF Transcript_7585/g.16460 Transcript_7585/m.16460 type:complete len:265 (-) Transcript_7585:250-1044(-)
MLRGALLGKEQKAEKQGRRLARGAHDAHGQRAEPFGDGPGAAAPQEPGGGEDEEGRHLPPRGPGGYGAVDDLVHGARSEDEGEAGGHLSVQGGSGPHGDQGDGVETEDEFVLVDVVGFHKGLAVGGEDGVAHQRCDQQDDSHGGKDGRGLHVRPHEDHQSHYHEGDGGVLRRSIFLPLNHGPRGHGEDHPTALDQRLGGIVEVLHPQVSEPQVEGAEDAQPHIFPKGHRCWRRSVGYGQCGSSSSRDRPEFGRRRPRRPRRQPS